MKNKCEMFDEILKFRERGAKFDIWKWPKRKKKLVMFDIWKWRKRKRNSGQSMVSGVNLLCGVALLSTPYTVGCLYCLYFVLFHSTLVYFFIPAVIVSLGLQTYPNISEAVFGIAGRLIISIVLYVLITLDVFPTLWLRDSSVLSYISAGGVFLTNSFGYLLVLGWFGGQHGLSDWKYKDIFLPNIYVSMEKTKSISSSPLSQQIWNRDIGLPDVWELVRITVYSQPVCKFIASKINQADETS
ncbi:Amino acid transporter, transmembrane [Artemisia annua]|uniref:Amino acid transporter, transmembrane n=1 Tax=Artemisia annua TaxID=35608 RepID=A0A2U1MTX9_ARTAN|nr:Amino acid transporter, transmembrane [Artemisia annua]